MDAVVSEALPPEAPLAMPVQDLAAAPTHVRRRGPDRWVAVRRALVLGGALALTVAATVEMSLVLALARWTVTGLALTVLFSALFLWIALSFTSALAGFGVMLTDRPAAGASALPRGRTALLMPVYHEDVEHVARTLAAMRGALRAEHADGLFDIFVLSDSRDTGMAEAEWRAVQALRGVPGPEVFYRRRTENEGRKAGNVAEWVRRFGAGYECFVVLDADSVMEARTLLALVAEMEQRPDTALLQTLPLLQGGETLFARLQDFAGQIYGPLIAAGLAWWHGDAGNYWGHNAIIRTRAFAACCGLPVLPGRKPFGGDVMSHDFVEAALLRRAGWAVRMVPLLPGSFEAPPPTLPDMATRDRRWCQGNLQHAGVIGAGGLHWVSRLHMATGIAAYASAPAWLGFLLLGIGVAVQARFLRPEYFPATHTLFPQWPVVDPQRALWVFALTLGLLLAPKGLALVAWLASGRRRAAAGGGRHLASGVMVEVVLSAVMSPVTMLTQARQFVSVLRGADSGWEAQRRAASPDSWEAALRFTRGHVVLGGALLALSVAVAPLLAAWMAPVLIGLLLAPALVWLGSSETAGRALCRWGVLVVPTDIAPPAALRAAAGPLPFCMQRARASAAIRGARRSSREGW
jgi:membrane glycosyltransferase